MLQKSIYLKKIAQLFAYLEKKFVPLHPLTKNDIAEWSSW